MRHFIYQDEKSHKFWAVEQQGNELHISWGKVGTKGQSQIKSFSDAAAAAKAELKLIAEKVKKGYVEQAKDNSLQPSQTVTGSQGSGLIHHYSGTTLFRSRNPCA